MILFAIAIVIVLNLIVSKMPTKYTEFDMTDGDRTEVGTEITLFLNEDCVEFANEYRAKEVIEKYCSFMPTAIFVKKANAEEEYETILPEEKTDKEIKDKATKFFLKLAVISVFPNHCTSSGKRTARFKHNFF